MSEQTLKFNDIVVNKKEFHASKQEIALNLVDIHKIVVSDKFKYSDDGSKHFIASMVITSLDLCVLYCFKLLDI